MNKIFAKTLLYTLLVAQTNFIIAKQSTNTIKNVEIFSPYQNKNGKIKDVFFQMIFDFEHDFTVKKEVDNERSELRLTFFNINLKDFKRINVMNKIKEIASVKNVTIAANKNKDEVKITIIFNSKISPLYNYSKGKKGFFIQFSEIKKPHNSRRLIVNVQGKDSLSRLNDQILTLASSSIINKKKKINYA